MPFRHLSRRASRWILPAFCLVCLLAVGVWTWWTFQVLGGVRQSTGGQRILIAGFAGLGLLTIFGVVTAVAIIESVIYETRIAVLSLVARQRLAAARRLRADLAGVLPEESEEESDGPRISTRPSD